MLMCTNVLFLWRNVYIIFDCLNISLAVGLWESRALESLKLEPDSIEHLEDVDLRILSLMQEDCRLSFNKMARKLGISVGTAFNHVKNLEKKGIINGYTITLDSGKLGYSLTVIIMIQAEGSFLADVETEISKSANAVAVYDITGDYDAVAIAKFSDRASLNAFIKNLLALPHIKRTVTHIALNVIKENIGVKL
jgi:DNA-binding Lrp family transcriptional regulator